MVAKSESNKIKGFEPMGSAVFLHTLYHKKNIRPDPDNYVAWMKAYIDGITDAVITGDDKFLIHLPPQFVLCDDSHVEIEVFRVPSGTNYDQLVDLVRRAAIVSLLELER